MRLTLSFSSGVRFEAVTLKAKRVLATNAFLMLSRMEFGSFRRRSDDKELAHLQVLSSLCILPNALKKAAYSLPSQARSASDKCADLRKLASSSKAVNFPKQVCDMGCCR